MQGVENTLSQKERIQIFCERVQFLIKQLDLTKNDLLTYILKHFVSILTNCILRFKCSINMFFQSRLFAGFCLIRCHYLQNILPELLFDLDSRYSLRISPLLCKYLICTNFMASSLRTILHGFQVDFLS